MSSKTLALAAIADRLAGAVIESSIGSFQVTAVFDLPAGSSRLPAAGPFDRVIAAVPSEAAAFRVLELPFRDRRRLAQAVGPALEEHVPVSLDEGLLAWDLVAPATSTGASVLAAIAPADQLDALRARLSALGVEAAPQKLLWTPSAVATAYRRAVGEQASFTALDVGEGGAIIARFEAGHLRGLRVVAPCSEELLLRNTVWQIATIADEDERIVVGGRHGARVLATLAQRLPGRRVEPLPAAAPVEGLAGHDWRELTALAGLVIAAAGDATPPVIDFQSNAASLFGLAAIRELQGEAGPLVRWGIAAAALAVLAIGIDYVQLFSERRVLDRRAEQIYASVMPPGSGGAGRALKLEMRLRELRGKADASSTGASGSPLALLAALSRDVPKNLDVVLDQVEQAPPAAKVVGHAGSFETVTKMQQALEKGGAFAHVEVKDVHAAVTGGGVEFQLELATAPGEGGA